MASHGGINCVAASLCESMQVLLLFFVSLLASSWVPFSPAVPLQEPAHSVSDKATGTEADIRLITNGGEDDEAIEEFSEDMDFEDDDERWNYSLGFVESNPNSVRHLHEKKGEVLIPCFGMWWPMGGPTYDYYVDDYYGGGKKKRRRSRKRSKAAKMKKKKS